MNKQIKHFISLALVLCLVYSSYSQDKTVMKEQIKDLNGILYEKDSDAPFTGKILTYKTPDDFDSGKPVRECIATEQPIVNGIVNGTMKYFHDYGQINLTFPYKNGLLEGDGRYYNYEGVFEKAFTASNGFVTSFTVKTYENGKTFSEILYKPDLIKDLPTSYDKAPITEGLVDGVVTVFYPNGQKKIIVNYKGGIAHGECNTFYENGQLHQKFFFEVGVLSGTHQEYSDDGKLINENEYFNDFL